ncbi:predicted protein [Scheffersomyces stipitis CBS 6054]|uniref:Rho GDP-dissociation inhibitor n=1 Tax=Scheffersomyces stipitis (strain ATCC 58785 / CBS 6054 / NBRC 10063 / NRRL Y-11545) TaxID=322104 RepID=A3LWQ8_PICST|nr:predicted protein [Scheffersomyces stipitis CBS 6054]ABN67679.1 predicted protein [Scheffersomyces stipitis CBS 6054]KAG2732410.1 hypothetical protein G9P44_004827 [Scheffersomyces stipitis]
MLPTHPDLEVIKFVTNVVGRDPIETPVSGAETIDVKIPESSKFVMTIHFKVKNRALKNFKYKQVVKKAGITIRNQEFLIGDYEPSDEVYTKDFPEDTTPGGFLMRGVYPSHSLYFDEVEQLLDVKWDLEITKK